MIPEVTLKDLEEAVWHLDEPMTDLSAIPLYLVCREAKKYVTVCLSGEGGDEIFAGYDRFKASKADYYYRCSADLSTGEDDLSPDRSPTGSASKEGDHQYSKTIYRRIASASGWGASEVAIFFFVQTGYPFI